MKKRNTGIPTVYKGTQFRSRLEARWAAFFDLCGFRWKYEPCDMAGWIPDFLLSVYGESDHTAHHIDPEQAILAEVRPSDLQDGLVEKVTKAQGGRRWRNVLLLGDGPQEDGPWFDLIGRMVLGTSLESGYLRRIHFAVINTWGHYEPPLIGPECAGGGRPTLLQMGYSADCLMLGQDANVSAMNENGKEIGRELWSMAGNATQWKGVQNHG